MKCVRLRLGLVIVLALLASGLVTPVSAGQEVPIKGKFAGSVSITSLSETEPLFALDSTATGAVSHLGQVVAHLTFPEVEIDMANMQVLVSVTEWFGTFTVANGDMILGTYTLSADTLPISPLGEIEFEADLQVASGTGKFEGVTGEAVAIGRANVLTRTFTVEIKGTLSTVGSIKK